MIGVVNIKKLVRFNRKARDIQKWEYVPLGPFTGMERFWIF